MKLIIKIAKWICIYVAAKCTYIAILQINKCNVNVGKHSTFTGKC